MPIKAYIYYKQLIIGYIGKLDACGGARGGAEDLQQARRIYGRGGARALHGRADLQQANKAGARRICSNGRGRVCWTPERLRRRGDNATAAEAWKQCNGRGGAEDIRRFMIPLLL